MSRRVLFIWYRREDRGTAVGLQSGFAGIRSRYSSGWAGLLCAARSDLGDARDEEGLEDTVLAHQQNDEEREYSIKESGVLVH